MKYMKFALITLFLVAVSACATDSNRSKDDSRSSRGSSSGGHSH